MTTSDRIGQLYLNVADDWGIAASQRSAFAATLTEQTLANAATCGDFAVHRVRLAINNIFTHAAYRHPNSHWSLDIKRDVMVGVCQTALLLAQLDQHGLRTLELYNTNGSNGGRFTAGKMGINLRLIGHGKDDISTTIDWPTVCLLERMLEEFLLTDEPVSSVYTGATAAERRFVAEIVTYHNKLTGKEVNSFGIGIQLCTDESGTEGELDDLSLWPSKDCPLLLEFFRYQRTAFFGDNSVAAIEQVVEKEEISF